jgi:hypothetical protein
MLNTTVVTKPCFGGVGVESGTCADRMILLMEQAHLRPTMSRSGCRIKLPQPGHVTVRVWAVKSPRFQYRAHLSTYLNV